MEKILCECGSMISKKQLTKHKSTNKHLNAINKKTLDLSRSFSSLDKNEDTESQSQSETEDEKDYEERQEQEEREEQEQEELIVKPTLKTKQEGTDIAQKRREHLNKIREKAHEALRQKKIKKLEEKINKEVQIETKARMYDEMIEKQKKDEEMRIQREQEQKEKERNKKLNDYDKILEENLRLKAKQNMTFNADRYAQHALIDQIRQQRMDYLTRSLGISL